MGNYIRPARVLICACLLVFTVCAFFISDADAATVAKGTTVRKAQTIKVKAGTGALVIYFKNKSCNVFSQLQTTAKHKKGVAVNGNNGRSKKGKGGKFAVPVKQAGTYYVYIRGEVKGTTYKVKHIPAGGTLSSGKRTKGTAYMNDQDLAYYTFTMKNKGALRVSVKDASPKYSGFSRIRLLKGSTVIMGEEHLLKGDNYTTYYGLNKGTYTIGVRSSSELFNITATEIPVNTAKYGSKYKTAKVFGRYAQGIITPGYKKSKWYRITLPKRSNKRKIAIITLKAVNNNYNLDGGLRFGMLFDVVKGKKIKKNKRADILNNNTITLKLATFSDRERNVYIRVSGRGGNSGIYSIKWGF